MVENLGKSTLASELTNNIGTAIRKRTSALDIIEVAMTLVKTQVARKQNSNANYVVCVCVCEVAHIASKGMASLYTSKVV